MPKNCVNINSIEFKELLEQSNLNEITLATKISNWQDINGVDNYPTLEQLDLTPFVSPNQIQYSLKIVDALSKINRNKFESGKLQGWLNDLSKLGVTSQQLDIFKEYAKDGMTRDEISLAIGENLGFTVESNLSTTQPNHIEGEPFEYQGFYYYTDNGYFKRREADSEDMEITKEEFDRTEVKLLSPSTQHYSNLTVPGGINYIEKAIVTPDIENISDTHIEDFNAGKSTMLGWVRSDEINKIVPTWEEGFKGDFNDYNKITNAEGEDVYVEKNTPKTKRILEIQSNLFQKYRGVENLSMDPYNNAVNRKDIEFKIDNNIYKEEVYEEFDPISNEIIQVPAYFKNNIEIQQADFIEARIKYENIDNLSIRGNSFLQLLNKEGNWINFFIKSIIQDSLKSGYEKVWFPRGETAAKVEGHQTIIDRIINIDDQIDKLKTDTERLTSSIENREFPINTNLVSNHNFNPIFYDGTNFILKEMSFLGDEVTNEKIISKEEAVRRIDINTFTITNNILSNDNKIKDLEKQRLEFKTQGIEKLAPIEAFYEKRVGNILKKSYKVNEITDEYGNQWNEVILDPIRDSKDILLNITVKPDPNEDGKSHINVYSKGQTELGRMLSNFAHSPFRNMEYDFASVEAFWYWYILSNAKMSGLFGNESIVPEEALDHLRTLDGADKYSNGQITSLGAKSEGERLAKLYKVTNLISPNKTVLKEIYYLKLANNDQLKDQLQKSTLPFTHYYIMGGKPTANQYEWTAKLWEEIRNELNGKEVIESEDKVEELINPNEVTRAKYDITKLQDDFPEYKAQGFETAEQQDVATKTIRDEIGISYIKNGDKLPVKETLEDIRKRLTEELDIYNTQIEKVNKKGFIFNESNLKKLNEQYNIYNADDLTNRVKYFNVLISNLDSIFNRAMLQIGTLGLVIRGNKVVEQEEDIIYTDEDQSEVEEDEIGDGVDANYMKSIYGDNRLERNPKTTASFKFQLFLHSIPLTEVINGIVAVKKNYLGRTIYEDGNRLFDLLLRDMADTEIHLGKKISIDNVDTYTGLLKILYDKSTIIPAYTYIIDRLTDDNNYGLATEFVNTVVKHYHLRESVNTSKIWNEKQVVGRNNKFLDSNYFTGHKIVIQQWAEEQKHLPIVKDDNGNLSINLEEVHKIRDDWKQYITNLDTRQKEEKVSIYSLIKTDEFKQKFTDTLASVGIVLKPDIVDIIIATSKKTLGQEFTTAIRLANTKGTAITDSFMYYLFNAFEPKENEVIDPEETRLSINNPIFGAKSENSINKIAKIAYQNSGEYYGLNTLDGKNHLTWNVGDVTFTSNVMRKLKQENSAYLSEVLSTPFAKTSIWGNALKTSTINRDIFNISWFDATRERGRLGDSKQRDEMDNADQTFVAMTGIQRGKIAKFFMLTHGDNAMAPMITNYKQNVDLVFDSEGMFKPSDDILSKIMDEVQGDIDRIESFQKTVKETPFTEYNIGANYFTLFPYLNPEVMLRMVELKQLTKSQFDEVWEEPNVGQKYYRLNITDKGQNIIRDIVSKACVKGITYTVQDWINQGIIINTGGNYSSTLMDKTYLDGIIGSQHRKMVITAADFYLNYLIAYSEMYRLIDGDPVIYTKLDASGNIDQFATLDFLKKRLKGAISPHIAGRWEENYYNRIVLANRIIDLDIPEYNKRLGKNGYLGVDTGDGFEHTTVKESLKFKRAYHLIEESTYHEMMKIIKDAKNGYYEFKDPKHLAVVLQQDKPIAFTTKLHDKYKMMMVHFTKSSSVPLIPQFTRGLEIDKLRRFMESNNIDRASYKSSEKLGSKKLVKVWGSTGKLSTKWDEFEKEFKSTSNDYIETLSRDDMGMQQQLPYGKTEVLTSSQLDKNLFFQARNFDGFSYKGQSVSGAYLENEKDKIKQRLMTLGRDRVIEKFGLNIRPDGTIQTVDLEKVRTTLIKEAQDRHWDTQDIKGLKLTKDKTQFIVPLFFNNSVDRIQSLLLSIITNEVVKHKMPGVGYLQSPAAGIRLLVQDEVDINNLGIISTTKFDPKVGLLPVNVNQPIQTYSL